MLKKLKRFQTTIGTPFFFHSSQKRKKEKKKKRKKEKRNRVFLIIFLNIRYFI
jgi:hypothetical protein